MSKSKGSGIHQKGNKMKTEKGIIAQPRFIIMYGVEGVGKSSFAADAPRPIFLDPEKGSRNLNVERNTDIKTFDDLMESLVWLRDQKHEFKTVVLDSLDHIEPMVWKHTCIKNKNVANIEEVGGGFQKGYGFALDYWRELISLLEEIRQKKQMHIICIAHAKTTTVNDPMQDLPYDRHTLKLHENKQFSAINLWKESVDAILFAAFEDTVFKVNKTDKKAKASGEGVRKIFTQRHAAWDAKNRYGLPAELTFELGHAWTALETTKAETQEPAKEKAPLETIETVESIRNDIVALKDALEKKDKASADKMLVAAGKAGKDIDKLIAIRKYARELVGV